MLEFLILSLQNRFLSRECILLFAVFFQDKNVAVCADGNSTQPATARHVNTQYVCK